MNEHTLSQLRSLRLDGMVHAIEEQATSTCAAALGFDERFSLLVQRELAWRDARRVQPRWPLKVLHFWPVKLLHPDHRKLMC